MAGVTDPFQLAVREPIGVRQPRHQGSGWIYEPGDYALSCPSCATRLAVEHLVRTKIDASWRPGSASIFQPLRDEDGWEVDGPPFGGDLGSAETVIGARLTLEPGFVNARAPFDGGAFGKYPMYRRARRPSARQATVRAIVIVECRCSCIVLLRRNSGAGDLASQPREQREQMMFDHLAELELESQADPAEDYDPSWDADDFTG